MTLETPLLLEATGGDAPISYDAYNFRTMFDALWSGEGVAGLADLVVTQRGAGANMSVDVSPGVVVIQGNAITNQGSYVCRSTSVVNLTIATAPGSGTRTDLIVAQLYDKQSDGGTQYEWTPLVITGSTTAPPSSVVLGRVSVPTGTASITTASNISSTGRQFAQLRQAQYRPVYSAQVSDAPWNVTNAGTDFTSGAWPSLTFTVPPSGQVFVTISCNLDCSATNTVVHVNWRVSSGSLTNTANSDLSTGARLYGSKRILATGTPGTSVTLQPFWQQSGGNATTNSSGSGELIVEPIL